MSAGSSQANAFTSATWTAVNRRGRPGPGQVGQTGQPSLAEPSPPLPDGVDVHAEIGGDRGVRRALGGGQDDLGADHVAVSGPGAACARPVSSWCSSADKMITYGEEMIMILLSRRHPGRRGARHAVATTRPARSGPGWSHGQDPDLDPDLAVAAADQPRPAALAPDQPDQHPLPGRVRLHRRRSSTATPSDCAGCATADQPTSGASPSTGPATTTTKTPTSPPATQSAPAKKPSTPPAASTSTTPPPGSTPDELTGATTSPRSYPRTPGSGPSGAAIV